MSRRDWIRQHRDELDTHIRAVCPNIGRLNDSERDNWLINDEGLYLWAKSDGVRL